MIIEKHPVQSEAVEDVYDFYELKEIELADGSTGSIKNKVGTWKISQLNAQKVSLQSQIDSINEKIKEVELLK